METAIIVIAIVRLCQLLCHNQEYGQDSMKEIIGTIPHSPKFQNPAYLLTTRIIRKGPLFHRLRLGAPGTCFIMSKVNPARCDYKATKGPNRKKCLARMIQQTYLLAYPIFQMMATTR
ncbi:hypothetical protein F5Y14DRAFT_412737 [Nemania sp. NC0429]|nr:hypothetical protein F5Y14DRAFT_412737 [Nemania sp. NC0429]